MSTIDEGRKFTEDCYASKEEVQSYYNMENISNYWNHILYYRQFFDIQTKMRNSDGNFFKVCLFKNLSYNAYDLQLKLMNDLFLFQSLSEKKKNEFLLSRKINSLKALCRWNQIKEPERSRLEKIASGELESVPNSLYPLDVYSKAYPNHLFGKEITIEDFEELNKLASGETSESVCSYRSGEFSDLVNPLTTAQPQKIKSLLKDFLVFLNEDKIPLLLKALTIPFAFLFIRPFDISNEETASLASKNFLYSKGLSQIGFVLDFESIAFSRGKETFEYMLRSQKTLDLTYFLQRCLPYLMEEEKRIRNELCAVSESPEEDPLESSITPPLLKQNALPVFPTQSKEEEIETIAIKLRQMFPQLKKKEAHFYAGHCTIGYKYTIDQFKTEEGTVYETARTSMDSLAKRGLYKKEKSKNKFVYSPIPIKE